MASCLADSIGADHLSRACRDSPDLPKEHGHALIDVYATAGTFADPTSSPLTSRPRS